MRKICYVLYRGKYSHGDYRCLHHYTGKTNFFCCFYRVSFATLDEEEIDFYVENYAPLDKAGAYGIQEWIGL